MLYYYYSAIRQKYYKNVILMVLEYDLRGFALHSFCVNDLRFQYIYIVIIIWQISLWNIYLLRSAH